MSDVRLGSTAVQESQLDGFEMRAIGAQSTAAAWEEQNTYAIEWQRESNLESTQLS